MAATVSSGPRYAPEDPTLPKPWKGLVDGKTGYLYFWNPETNITQYERPVAPSGAAPSLAPPKSAHLTSSVHIHQSSQGQQRGGNSSKEENGRYNGDNNGGPKLAAIPGGRNHQSGRDVPNGSVNIGHGGSSMFDDGPSAQALKSSARGRGSDPGSSISMEAYLRQHEITISGDNVPPPFMSFESTGFPPEILREVRYLLQRGANVVRCAALFMRGLELERPYMVDQF